MSSFGRTVDKVRVEVTAKASGKYESGQSGQASKTKTILSKCAPELYSELSKLVKQEIWEIFDCAEPNALACLLDKNADQDIKLANVYFEFARREYEAKPVCKNCALWLEGKLMSGYKIRKEFLPKEVQKEVDLNNNNEFPSLAEAMGKK